jgi:hypothetical protein
VAAAVARFISAKMLRVDMFVGAIATMRQFTAISMIRMKVIVYPAVEMFIAVKPWAYADERAVVKPFGSVVAVWRAVVRSNVVIPLRTFRSRPDIHADAHLGVRVRRGCQKTDSDYSSR